MGDEIVVCPICHKRMVNDKCTCDYEAPHSPDPVKKALAQVIEDKIQKDAIGMKPRVVTKKGSEQAKTLAEFAREIALGKSLS